MKKANKTQNKPNKTTTNKYAKAVMKSTAVGVLFTALALMLCSFVMSAVDIPQAMVEPMALGCAMLGCFVSGYLCSRINKEKGFFLGLVCGLFIFTLTFITGILIIPFESTPMLLVKLLAMLVSAGVGGMVGVNKKEKRR